MASRHGETMGLLVDDLLVPPNDRPVIVDWSGNAQRTSGHR
ncbi:hypothetical protein [Actinophytocola oryzae]|uniref:Uncharacterized protein n=1 Tax=Actinophytocola oryzae TaxID=502181 RepID=A0A4R7VYI1_9PSEU|nr:hypothetical protein [Actinophytocola oryzae]TDV55240.1 hypothetical protein CLV71_103481 [Actinophytocola oryzae]